MTKRTSSKPPWPPASGFLATGGVDRDGVAWQIVEREAAMPAFLRAEVVGQMVRLYREERTLWVAPAREGARRVFTLPGSHETVALDVVENADLYSLALAAHNTQVLLLRQASAEWRRRNGS